MTYDFTALPTLSTPRLRLEPMGSAHFDGAWATLQDAESLRLTGTHASFTESQIHAWLESLGGRDDRADWAIIRKEDDTYLGEVVLHDHDPENRSLGFRIGLAGSSHFGQGFGTEATAAAVDHAFKAIGVHRVELEVYSFNPRARRVYEKVGFQTEGTRRQTLLSDGFWVDSIMMSLLSSDPRRAVEDPGA